MRLFIAVQFNEMIKDQLCNAIAQLRETAVSGKFTLRDNLHLTLNFIGETDRVKVIEKAMDTVTTGSFPLYIGSLGKFKRNEGDIYWAGVRPSDELSSVYRKLYDSLVSDGFQLESREYKPHLTLGRDVVLPQGFDKSRLNGSLPELAMSVEQIHLMKSERINGKLTYTSIYHTNLK